MRSAFSEISEKLVPIPSLVAPWGGPRIVAHDRTARETQRHIRLSVPADAPGASCLISFRLCGRRPPSARGCRRFRCRCFGGWLLPLLLPPRLEEPSELEIAAARDLLMPFLRRPSYCLSFFARAVIPCRQSPPGTGF
jgi:hypothetical protein